MPSIENDARCIGRGNRNTQEVQTAGSTTRPHAIEIGAGVLSFWRGGNGSGEF